jgi:ABC-2 type transport system permease protein
MPIHDQGYRRYAGGRVAAGHAWWVIARAGLRMLLAKRVFVALLLLAWLPFIVRAVQIYAATNLPQATFLAPSARMFRQFLEQQQVFTFFITVYAGAGLIANDHRANALQIYLSKPLTRLEYIAGKLAILGALLLLVTWVPSILLLVVQVLFSGSFAFFRENLFLLPAITVFSVIQVGTVSLAMLALSSLSRSSRYVAVLYAGLIFFSQAMYGVLVVITRDTRLAWVAMSLDLAQIGDAIFRMPLRFHMPLWAAALAIVALIAASAIVLEKRVRGVEVVA